MYVFCTSQSNNRFNALILYNKNDDKNLIVSIKINKLISVQYAVLPITVHNTVKGWSDDGSYLA